MLKKVMSQADEKLTESGRLWWQVSHLMLFTFARRGDVVFQNVANCTRALKGPKCVDTCSSDVTKLHDEMTFIDI